MPEYIKDSMGKNLAFTSKVGNNIHMKDFATNKTVAIYNPNTNKTLDLKTNTQCKGNQTGRFIGR